MKAIADKNQEIETTDAFTHGKKMTKVGESKIACKGYVFISILFYITGLLHMVWLKASPILFCIVGGTILIAYGIIKVIGYFSNDLYCLAFQYDLGCGLFLAVVGVIVLVRNLHIQEYLMPGLGLLILMDSLMKVQTAKEARLFEIKLLIIFSTSKAKHLNKISSSQENISCTSFLSSISFHVPIKSFKSSLILQHFRLLLSLRMDSIVTPNQEAKCFLKVIAF